MNSPFGSHSSMICDNIVQDTLLGFERIIGGEVILEDEKGYYVTLMDRVDNNLADPKRFNSKAAREI